MTLEKMLYPTRVHITGGWKKVLMMRPLLRIVFIFLLAAQATPNTVLAQVKAAPPLSGVIGKVQSVTDSSIDVLCRRCIDGAGGWKRSSEADHHISRGTAWSCRRQCSDRSAGRNYSRQNDQWLCLSPCRVALTHDERHCAERQRHHSDGPISGRL